MAGLADLLGVWGPMVLNIVILILSLAIGVGGVWGGLYFYSKWKKYKDYRCIIINNQGDISYDAAGIFVDNKTMNKRFFLKNNNVGLSPDNVMYVNMGGKRTVFLKQDGLKNFSYLNMPDFFKSLSNEDIQIKVCEEDVNWAVNAFERQKKLFQQNILLQYMPYIIFGFVVIAILVIFIYFFKNFDSLKQLGVELTKTAEIMRQIHTGTTVIG